MTNNRNASTFLTSKIVHNIIDFENGELEFDAEVELFQSLLDSGQLINLQGSYTRHAQVLIDAGFVIQ